MCRESCHSNNHSKCAKNHNRFRRGRFESKYLKIPSARSSRPLWNFEAFNFRSRIGFEHKPLARNLKGGLPRNIQFYACIIQLSLCIRLDLCNIEFHLVQYTYRFNGTCSKCAQFIEMLIQMCERESAKAVVWKERVARDYIYTM